MKLKELNNLLNYLEKQTIVLVSLEDVGKIKLPIISNKFILGMIKTLLEEKSIKGVKLEK